MRRFVIPVLVIGLFAGATVPAEAAKKKKKKRVTFEASGTVAVGNPLDFLAEVGVTRTEFTNTCAVPVSQGLDAFIVEVPDEVSAVTSNIQITGSDLTSTYDLDMYFFDDSCASIGIASTPEPNEFGVMPSGTRYILVSAFQGAQIEFTLNSVQI